MRAINTFCLIVLMFALAMTTTHYAVTWLLRKYAPKPPVVHLLPPPDTRAALPVEIEKFDAAAGAKWLAEARVVAMRIERERGEVTADDVWNTCRPPENVDGRLLGSVFAGREWEKIGQRRSERGNNNNRYIAVWKRKVEVMAA